jgi:NAD-dependent deacetylase
MSEHVAVLSGSGLSAESGLPTFRDAAGLWNQYSWRDLASPDGWREHPELVLAFYNERRAKAWTARPNAAHLAIASLEKSFNVVVITQNVDNLHERAGSTKVLHLHGELAYARGTGPSRHRVRIDAAPIVLGQKCAEGSQLRPDIVWFGEETQHMDEAARSGRGRQGPGGGDLAGSIPAAGLVEFARPGAEKVPNALDMTSCLRFRIPRGPATSVIPEITERWSRAHR